MAPNQPRSFGRAYQVALDILNGRHAVSKLIPVALWLADAVLCGLVIWKIPYTEIDWVAYMQQVSQFVAGERDYTKIKGGTGPLVYPAAHVYVYRALHYLTDQGENILLAQQLFAGLYLATLAVVMLCYWQAKVPPYVFAFLILSKRLHSIFILRCFNDCFAVFFLFLTIYLFQKRQWTLGALAYSWGLGIKMSLLLTLPAVGIILFLQKGLSGSLRVVSLMFQLQFLIAIPFLGENPLGYLSRAFELSRQFKFEWTVNWRMVGEEVFLSKSFAIGLLATHVLMLLAFIVGRYLRVTGVTLPNIIFSILHFESPFTPQEERAIGRRVTPEYIMTTMLSANLVGLLFARSLHYQFYAYLFWCTPYLLWRALGHSPFIPLLWGVQEAAWNVFPSTDISSAMVINVMAATVVLVYFRATKEYEEHSASSKANQGQKKTE